MRAAISTAACTTHDAAACAGACAARRAGIRQFRARTEPGSEMPARAARCARRRRALRLSLGRAGQRPHSPVAGDLRACSRGVGHAHTSLRWSHRFDGAAALPWSARVDDVERLPEAGQIALFNAYNELRERGGALVAAGDAPPCSCRCGPILVTRLGWGSLSPAHAPRRGEGAGAHRRSCAPRLRSHRDFTDYLLRHVRRDMASLVAMLDALIAIPRGETPRDAAARARARARTINGE